MLSRRIVLAHRATQTSITVELVIDHALRWDRESLATGAAMNVKKMELLPGGRLLFRTSMDGIGILDGGKITLLH